MIQSHTNEAGVADLQAKLAAICRQVARRRRPGGLGPEVVTPDTVRELLGDGDALPSAVREAIARERRRLGNPSDGDVAPTNDWIDCLEQLPWTRRADAPIDLAQVRAALDAGHAGLERAKACIMEHLAVRRRNPRGPAVLCFAGPPGGGKTSLAHCVAEALGRGFVKLACGGLRDETDLRGHNRTWKDAQPGWILRELRHVGSKDPVFVLDEIDKLGRAPAAVLLEVLDPAQHARFRDAFVELPFDLSEVLFITTANEPARIPPALRDRPRDHRPARLYRDREARHRRDAPDRRAEPGGRLGGHAGTVHPRRLPADHPRLHERAGHPSVCPLPAGDLPQGDARARDRRRLADS